MATIAKDNGGGDFVPAPEGTHIARCVRVIDLGTQAGSAQYPAPKHQVHVAWELCEEMSEYEGEKRPMIVSRNYTLSLHKKAGLRHDLETWRGKPFTAEELDGFDIARVLGHPCMVTIVHSKSSDGAKTYANIKAVSAVPKSMAGATPPAHHDLMHYQIEDRTSGGFDKLPNWLREKIMASAEWNASAPSGSGDGDPGFADDDIPF